MGDQANRRRWLTDRPDAREEPGMAIIELRDDEALVLFDLLAREIDRHKEKRLAGIIEHPAEF
jgi:hypothetical protein